MDYLTSLDTPLLRLSEGDYFTLRNATEGVAVFGAIGSGKTSSSKSLASAYLRAGMGGLVLAAKPDEVELWRRYAYENGRAADLVLFGDEGGGEFNFLDYELKAQGMRGIGSVTECIMRIIEAERVVMATTGGSEPFWERSPRQILNNCVPVLFSAWGTVKMEDIYRFIASAPKSRDDMNDSAWQARSFMFKTVVQATDAPQMPIDAAEGAKIMQFWQDEFAQLDSKTRGNIVINLTSAIDRFLRGRLRDHFCRGTTITPEDTLRDGKIIVLAMPALSWNEDGLIAQQVFKYMWQRSLLRRNSLPEEYRTRPQFLWVDEAQYFVNARDDAAYQSACRSSLGCTVFLCQSLPSYIAAMGGNDSRPRAEQLLGNFVTKIFLSNADPVTNQWASDTIGRQLIIRRNFSTGWGDSRSTGASMNDGDSTSSSGGFSSSYGPNGGSGSSRSTTRGHSTGKGTNVGRSTNENRSEGFTEVMDYAVEPRVFVHELRTGGPINRNQVDAVFFQSGRRFAATGNAVLPVTFQQ